MRTTMIGSMLLLLMTCATAFAADEFVITNPNYDAYIQAHSMETKPRDPAVIEAEKKLLVEAAQTIAEYAKANGAEQAGAEITKGKDGAFAQYHNIGGQFRMMIMAYFPSDSSIQFMFQGHNLFTSMVGMKMNLNDFADLSGWKFGMEYYNVTFSPEGRGWVDNIFWTDELWANNKVVRYIAYNQVLDRERFLGVTCALAVDE